MQRALINTNILVVHWLLFQNDWHFGKIYTIIPLVKHAILYPGHWRVYHFYHITLRHDLMLSLSLVMHALPMSWEPAMHASLVSMTKAKHKNYWIIHWIFKNICFLIYPSRPEECFMKRVDDNKFRGTIPFRKNCHKNSLHALYPSLDIFKHITFKQL